MKKKDNTELITQKAAKAPKSGKTLKGQLFSAVAMMLVATIALGSSTYAWFINNRTVEVQNIDLTVSASTSLLASVGKPASVAANNTAYDAANFTPYNSIIVGADITETTLNAAGWTNFFINPLTPASVTDTELAVASVAYPQFYKSLDKLTSGKVSNFTALTHDSEGAPPTPGLGVGPVKHLRLAFKSSAVQSVYFGSKTPTLDTIDDLITAKANASDVNGKNAAAQADAIRSVLRLAIVPKGGTPTVFQFDDGDPVIITGGGNNTYYPSAVWPATNDPDNLLNDTTGAPETIVGSTKGIYAGVAAVSNELVSKVSKLTANMPSTGSIAAQNADAYIVDPTPDTIVTTNKKALFTLVANTDTIVDVYMWLDGTDEDCLNELSQYQFSLALPFVAGPAPTTAP